LSAVDRKLYRTSDYLFTSLTNGLILRTGTICNMNSEFIWFLSRLRIVRPVREDNHIAIGCDNLKCPYCSLYRIYLNEIDFQ